MAPLSKTRTGTDRQGETEAKKAPFKNRYFLIFYHAINIMGHWKNPVPFIVP